jgi:hypothetical protein
MSRSATPAQSKAGWEHFPHDADVGVLAISSSVPASSPGWSTKAYDRAAPMMSSASRLYKPAN